MTEIPIFTIEIMVPNKKRYVEGSINKICHDKLRYPPVISHPLFFPMR
jgi:hypothetical protein